MTNKEIYDACNKHGAKTVYEAARSRMAGDRAPLAGIGLISETLADADLVASEAFKMLCPSDVAFDLADATIAAVKIK